MSFDYKELRLLQVAVIEITNKIKDVNPNDERLEDCYRTFEKLNELMKNVI